jgi:hypothetical protein
VRDRTRRSESESTVIASASSRPALRSECYWAGWASRIEADRGVRSKMSECVRAFAIRPGGLLGDAASPLARPRRPSVHCS